jgi:hypothetical protein
VSPEQAPPAAPAAEGELAPAAAEGELAPPAEGELAPAASVVWRQWDHRLEGLADRYPWLVPDASFQRCCLGMLVLVVLALAIHNAARISAAEAIPFHRAVTIASGLLLALLVQIMMLPGGVAALGVAAVGNSVLLLLCLRRAYELSLPAAFGSLLVFLAETGLVVAFVHLLDRTFRSMGTTAQ